MNTKFQKGDKVIAISNLGDTKVTVGNTYVVTAVMPEAYANEALITTTDETGRGFCQFESRWEMAEPKDKYMVIDPDNNFIDDDLYNTYEEAVEAAKDSLIDMEDWDSSYVVKVISKVSLHKREPIVTLY